MSNYHHFLSSLYYHSFMNADRSEGSKLYGGRLYGGGPYGGNLPNYDSTAEFSQNADSTAKLEKNTYPTACGH